MYMSTGKYDGVSIEKIVLTDPSYIIWLIGTSAKSREMAIAQTEAIRLIAAFDARPIQAKCHDCKGTATRLTGYDGSSISLYPWCEACDPRGSTGKATTVIRTYKQALRHNDFGGTGTKAGQKRIIGAMANLKGLSRPMTEANLMAFFG